MNAANLAVEEKRTGRIVVVAEWCRISGYSVAAAEGMIAEGMPLAVKGGPGRPHKVDTAQAIVWLMRRERARTERDVLARCGREVGDDGVERAASVKDRMQAVKLRQAEIELEQLEGSLIDMGTVEAVLANLVTTAAASRLGSMPARLAPKLAIESDEGAVRKMLDDEVYEVRMELSKVGPEELVKENG